MIFRFFRIARLRRTRDEAQARYDDAVSRSDTRGQHHALIALNRATHDLMRAGG